MATRTIKQISKELAQTDKPSEQLLNKQLSGVGASLKAQQDGLRAQQKQSFGNILTGAKSRGLKFSGIPLAEQAEFTATKFLPAMAQLQQGAQQQRFGLQGSLADIIRQRGLTAQQIRQTELDRDESSRQAAASRAAAAQSSGYQSIIEELKKQIASFGQPQNSRVSTGQTFGLEESEKQPGTYYNPLSGEVITSPFLPSAKNVRLSATDTDQGIVYTGGF